MLITMFSSKVEIKIWYKQPTIGTGYGGGRSLETILVENVDNKCHEDNGKMLIVFNTNGSIVAINLDSIDRYEIKYLHSDEQE